MNFLKAILISFLAIVVMDKIYSYIKSKKTDLSIPQEVSFSSTADENTSIAYKPTKQVVAKTRKNRFPL